MGTRPICYRASPEIAALVDRAAADDEVTRSDWIAGLIDRGLEGKGLLSAAQVRDRHLARVEIADHERSMGRGVRRYRPHPEDLQ